MQEKGNHAKMVFLRGSFYLSSFIFIYCTCKLKLKYIVVNGFFNHKIVFNYGYMNCNYVSIFYKRS